MDLKLNGKRALVTGSSSGIGEGIALELAAEGVSMVIHGRDRNRAEEVREAVRAKGVDAIVAIGDITDDDDMNRIADAALEAFGGIDILVNCAGGVVRSDNPPWTDMSSAEWLQAFNFNVVSIVRLAQRLVPGMIDRGWGRIINISSLMGTSFTGLIHDYGAAKAAVEHLTINLSKTLAPKGVTVNGIAPGHVKTPQFERWILALRKQNGWPADMDENEHRYTTQVAPQPITRVGRPEEIGAAVTFLASPRSDYTTGAILRIDGGANSGR